MQTGRDPVRSPDKPRDFLDGYQTTTCSLLSGDSQCPGWIQTFLSGVTGWDEGQIDMQVSLLQSNWTSAKPVKTTPQMTRFRDVQQAIIMATV